MYFIFRNKSVEIFRFSFVLKMLYQLLYLVSISFGKIEILQGEIMTSSYIFILSSIFDLGNGQSVIGDYKVFHTFQHLKALIVSSIILLPVLIVGIPIFIAPLLASSGIIRNIYIVNDKIRSIALLDLGSFICSLLGLFIAINFSATLLWVVFIPVLSETIVLLTLYRRLLLKLRFRVRPRFAFWYNNAQDVIFNQLDILLISRFFDLRISENYFLIREWYKRVAQASNVAYLRLFYNYTVSSKWYLVWSYLLFTGLVYLHTSYAVIFLVVPDIYLVYTLIRRGGIKLLNTIQFMRFILFLLGLLIMAPMDSFAFSELLLIITIYVFEIRHRKRYPL